MSRRIGQKGSVFQRSQKWDPVGKTYGRFWVDVPGRRRQRRTIALGVCRTPSIAKQKLRDYIETTEVNSKQTFTSTSAGDNVAHPSGKVDCLTFYAASQAGQTRHDFRMATFIG